MKSILILVLGLLVGGCDHAPEPDAVRDTTVALTSFSEDDFLENTDGIWDQIAPGVYEQTSASVERTVVAFGQEGLSWERDHIRDDEHAAWLDDVEAVLASAPDELSSSVDPQGGEIPPKTTACDGDSFRVATQSKLDLVTARVSASAQRDPDFGPSVRATYKATSDIWFTNDPTNDGDSDRKIIINGCCGVSTAAAHPNRIPAHKPNQKCKMAGYAAIAFPTCPSSFVSVLSGGSCDGIGFRHSTR